MRSVNPGILAHVDAGKTSLTERLLYAAGVIDEIGSVDHGSTQTDTLALERRRGITIKSAVVSFVVDDVIVSGAAHELIGTGTNPFRATVGLRIDPAAVGSGVDFRLEVELGSMPYAFVRAVEETVRGTLRQGLRGWQVTDCTVTLTHSGYTPPPPYGWSVWSSSAGDFRRLTPLVLMTALTRAGTTVHEPLDRFRLEIAADTLGTVWPALIGLGSLPQAPTTHGSSCTLEGEIPAARVRALQQRLPGLTRGEGVLESEFAGYRPVRGTIPTRPRTDHNPLDRREYLRHATRGS